jgi:hypothetical protein
MPGTSPGRVVIVGGGAAAMRCAFELRDLGCEDHLEMLCAEDTPPYDRTLVSKALISGDDVGPERLMLAPAQAYADQDIELRLGSRATALDVPARRLTLADGSRVAFDRLVLCMGGEPVRPPRLTVDGVVTLRDLGDAQRLAPMLDPGRRVVIVGGGFIGTEVANMTVTRGLDTTVVEAELPFASLLGEHVAQRLCAMHRRRGVTLLRGRRSIGCATSARRYGSTSSTAAASRRTWWSSRSACDRPRAGWRGRRWARRRGSPPMPAGARASRGSSPPATARWSSTPSSVGTPPPSTGRSPGVRASSRLARSSGYLRRGRERRTSGPISSAPSCS